MEWWQELGWSYSSSVLLGSARQYVGIGAVLGKRPSSSGACPRSFPSPVIGANLAQLHKQLAAPRGEKEGLASWK